MRTATARTLARCPARPTRSYSCNARPVGSQEINYYGQSSTLYTVQLGVKAYRVSDGSVMWTSSTEQVNFTSLNAAEKAREAIDRCSIRSIAGSRNSARAAAAADAGDASSARARPRLNGTSCRMFRLGRFDD